MFVMTPEMTKHADEKIKKMLADKKKKKKEDYLAARDARLKSLGLENCDEYFVQKIAEVKQIVGTVEKETVKEAKEMLEQIQGTSEAGASEAVPESAAFESATVPETSEASAKVIQTSDSPTIISPPSSSDSDNDNIPLSQKIKILPKPSSKPKPFQPMYPAVLQWLGEISRSQIDIFNRLPADHPLQPPVIEPLNMIPAKTHLSTSTQPSQTTQQTPLQAEQSSAAAEGSEDPEEPNTTYLPHLDSPSNLFSLERHLGGEITKTPQKATKSVPKKTDLVNKQPPQPSHQTTPEHTSTQTSTPTYIHTSPLQMIIPEYVVDTLAAESVHVTESEPSVTITVSKPTQKPTKNPTLTTNDQPSSSSSPSI